MTYGLADFLKFARKLRTESGEPLKVAKFQRDLLEPYFSGTRETVVVLPTGNGKTTLLAAVGVYHMLRVPNARVLIVAAAEEQAGTLFEQMRTLIEGSDYDDLLSVKNGTRRIYHVGPPSTRPLGEIRVIASEVSKQEGAIPTLVLMDELHAHKDLRMYEMLRDKLRKRAGETGCGRMITISTAGWSFTSPLYLLRQRVHEMDTFRRSGMMNRASGSGFEWFEMCLADEDDVEDLALVARANPARWLTRDVLAMTRASPTMSVSEWMRSACNRWTAGVEAPIAPALWDGLRVDIGRVEDGEEVVLAPSVGHNAAVAVAARRDDGRVAITVEHLEPEDGKSIYERTEDLVADLCERYQVLAAHMPRGGFRRSRELLEGRSVPVVDAPHSPTRLVEFSGTLNRLLYSGLLMHDGDPATRTQVLAAGLKTTETGEKYVADDRSRAVIAIAAACHAVTALPDIDPEYVAL